MSKIYCIGSEGGFDGSDGLRNIHLQILTTHGERQALVAYHINRGIRPDERIRPMGKVKVIIPASPDHPDALIDAFLAFFPKYFESCPSLAQVAEGLANARRIDFHLDGEPTGWVQLREEARPIFKNMIIYEASLNKISPDE